MLSDHDFSSNTEMSFKYLHEFPIRSPSNKYRKLLEAFKKKELRTAGNLAQNEISQCSDVDRRWYDFNNRFCFNQIS